MKSPSHALAEHMGMEGSKPSLPTISNYYRSFKLCISGRPPLHVSVDIRITNVSACSEYGTPKHVKSFVSSWCEIYITLTYRGAGNPRCHKSVKKICAQTRGLEPTGRALQTKIQSRFVGFLLRRCTTTSSDLAPESYTY